MTITQLNDLTLDLMAKGAGKRGVCISKETFTHRLEADGATILDVEKADLKMFPMIDADGGMEVDSRGREKYCTALVLEGGNGGEALRGAVWIDCAERLPGHFHSVLAFITATPTAGIDPFMDISSYDPEKKEWHHSTGMEDEIVTVSHWLPLPYPPARKRVRVEMEAK